MKPQEKEGFFRLSQIIPELLPIGRSTFLQRVAEGKAPQPIKLGPKTTVWRKADIHAFLESLAAGGAQ